MNGRRLLSVCLATGLIAPISIFSTAAAAEERVVRESVVSMLGPDGRVVGTSVVQLLHLDARGSGEVELRVPKLEELESYRNLSGFRGPSGEGPDLVWRSSDRLEARALAAYGGQLPVEVSVRYFLDGRQLSAEEIKRQKGDVRMEVELTNVSGRPETLEYKAVTSPYLTSVVSQYIPIEYAVRVEFPTDRWSAVGGEDVRVLVDGDKEIASSSGILSPPLTAASRTLVFEASSDDILTPRIQVYAIPGIGRDVLDALETQFDALRALYAGTGSVGESLGRIYDGTVSLVDGVGELMGGLGSIDPNTRKPVIDLGADGLPTTLLGTLGFLAGALRGDVLPGIGERDPESGRGVIVTDEKGATTTLLGSLQSQKDTYDQLLIPGMAELIGGLDQVSAGLIGGGSALTSGIDSVVVGVDTISAGLSSGGAALTSGLGDISDGIAQLLSNLQTNDPGNPGFREGLLAASGGLGQLLAGLQTNDPGDPGFREGLLALRQAALDAQAFFELLDPLASAIFGDLANGLGQLLLALGDSGDPPNDATVIGAVQLVAEGLGQLVAALGDSADPPSPATVIGALQLLMGGLDTQAIPGAEALIAGVLGGLAELKGGLVTQLLPGTGQLVEGVLGGLSQIRAGLTNAEFTVAQAALGGLTPKELYQECPGCFDPDHPAFDPATADPRFQPRFFEVFTLFSEGVEAALPRLQSFDDSDPGLVEGLQQIAGGLETLSSKLHTFDPDDPGLVDAMQLVRGGLQQVHQGLFATNELGLRTMRGQIGDQGDTVGRNQAAVTGRLGESALGTDADVVSVAYVFDLPAQRTAANDNARRGALMALALAGTALLATRVRRFDP